ncbi:MAG: HD domain-containing protein [Clostridium sp.]|nr:HD domain-containing protein [Acetatifactor muris]MCM1528133.1 HD domain-containing protein [Bacteroides sp.]MCM1564260.1 HD domain-containing protein [Clostridium sp.]
MAVETKRINRSLMIGWTIIVLILSVSYLGEYLKQAREIDYVVIFWMCTILPNLFCHVLYRRKPDSETLRYTIVCCYFIMYIFSMATGSTYMVFSYVLPLLSLLILYHQPNLILGTGAAALILNLSVVLSKLRTGQLDLESGKEAEIQLALVILCFGGCYAATRIYDNIHRQNMRFMEELEEKNLQNRRITMQTIMTIVNTIDAKDEYTKGHSQRVSEYAAALAAELGMREEDVERIRYIALLHDIGKIGVPDAILNKPGRLDDTEFALMKQHTVMGGDILKDISSMEDLDVGAKYHHERYDGNGYPEGLKGEEIPLVARIIGIADAYDAMTSHRIYRKRLSDEAVQREIKRCAGTQFDPGMAEAFLRLLEQGKVQTISPDSYIPSDGADDAVGDEVLRKILGDAGAYNSEENHRDNLTGVYNRSYGEELVTNYLKDGGAGCLLAIDLDALRNVNSADGFLRGDLYLNTVANILKQSFENIILYRSGGDQFICLICNMTDKEKARRGTDLFYANVERAGTEDRELKDLSVSTGVLLIQSGEYEPEDALSKVERALYFAKQQGKGSVCMYHEAVASAQSGLSKVDLENLLRNIRKQGSYSRAYEVNYPEFARMVNYLENVMQRNQQQMQIIMFTMVSEDEENVTIEEKTDAMKALEEAVHFSLRKVDVTMPFSSSQRIVVLMNMSEENIRLVINRILSDYYKRSTDRRFRLIYDIADWESEEA